MTQQQQQQQQQDYSSISPVDEINDEYNSYQHSSASAATAQQFQHLILNSNIFATSKANEIAKENCVAKENWACSSVNDTNSSSNPVSSNSLTNSSNSSNLSSKRSSRSGDDLPALVSQFQQQHYANHNQNQTSTDIEKLKETDSILNNKIDQLFISELVGILK